MEQRVLGRTGRRIGIVGLGAWQIGADWGPVSDTDALATLHAAVEAGVTFIDTADVYGDGRSERLIGRLLRERPGAGLVVATKMGRRARPHVAAAYTLDAFRGWTDRSRTNLGVDTLDLVQLHCPPTDVYHRDAVFDALDTLVAERRIAAYGVSVEACAEALAAIAASRGRHGPDHPQLLPAEAARRGAAGRPGGRRRDHRPRAPGERAARRPLRRDDHLRRRGSPHVQPPRRGLRRG